MENTDTRYQLILKHMNSEVIAARALFMDGLLEQAALHTVRGWHALACLQTVQSDEPFPPLGDFTVNFDETPIAKRVKKANSTWAESYQVVEKLAEKTELSSIDLDQAASQKAEGMKELRRQRKLLEFQINMAEVAHHKLNMTRRIAWFRGSGSGAKMKLLAIGVVGLAVLAGGGFLIYSKVSATGEEIKPKVQARAPRTPRPEKKRLIVKNETISVDKISKKVVNGAAWDQPPAVLFGESIKVELGKAVNAKTINISLDHNDTFKISFELEGKTVGAPVTVHAKTSEGMLARTIEVPEEAVTSGYDAVKVTVVGGDGWYSIAHLLLPE